MMPLHRKQGRGLFLLFVGGMLLTLLGVAHSQNQQAGSCGYPLIQTQRNLRWAWNTTVQFQLSSNIPEPARTQILNAIGTWNRDLAGFGIPIQFVEGSENAAYGLRVQFGVTSTGAPAEVSYSRVDVNNSLAGAAITINPNHFFNEVSPIALTFDPNRPGYEDIFFKIMLHELGHTLGLDHRADPEYDPCLHDSRGGTVMNGICSPNDHNGDGTTNIPPYITICDEQAIKQAYGVIPGGGGDESGCYYETELVETGYSRWEEYCYDQYYVTRYVCNGNIQSESYSYIGTYCY